MNSSHHSTAESGNTRALTIVAWLQGGYFIFELGIGLWTGSIAVLADALHSLSTVGGVVLALVAARLSQKGKSTPYHTFGWFRAEIIGTFFNGLLLFVMAAVVLGMGVYRFMAPLAPPSAPMLVAAAGAIITETIAIRLLHQAQKESMNIKGAYMHVVQVFLGSLFIIIAALVIQFTGFILIDPILGILFALTLFLMSGRVIKGSLNVLLERTPEELNLEQIIQEIQSWEGVRDVHHIHAWSLTSGKHIFSSHIRVEDYRQGEAIQKAVHDMLTSRFHVYFTTIQIERECTDQGQAAAIDVMRSQPSE